MPLLAWPDLLLDRFSSRDEPGFLSAFLSATAALILSLYVFAYFFLNLLFLLFHPQISFPSATLQLWLCCRTGAAGTLLSRLGQVPQ